MVREKDLETFWKLLKLKGLGNEKIKGRRILNGGKESQRTRLETHKVCGTLPHLRAPTRSRRKLGDARRGSPFRNP